MRLHYRHAGNTICVKLVNQENLMAEQEDHHEMPNIDVNFVAPHGRVVRLPGQVLLHGD